MQIHEYSKGRAVAAAKDPFATRVTANLPKRLDPLALLDHTSVACLRRIAENDSIPSTFLEQLSMHPDVRVREAVADNRVTPIDTLWVLARDPCADVRYAMAENHNLPEEILQALTADENPYVASRAQFTLVRVSCGSIVVTVDFEDRGGGRAVLRSC